MKKIFCSILVLFGLIFSFDAEARYGRVGGFRSSGFRSYSYSRSVARTRARNAINSSKTVNNAKTKALSKTDASSAKAKAISKAKTKTANKTKTVTVNKTINNNDNSFINHAPLWFLIGHSTTHDKVNVINNTNEKFSCSDCESVKDEVEVYKVCMEKCIK